MSKMIKEFKEFAMRGNVMDLAVGVVIGGAFGKITSSLVADVINPILGILVGKINFSNLFIAISPERFDSIQAAQAAKVPVITYGNFINNVIDFLVIAFVIFLFIRAINKLRRKEEGTKANEPTTKNCPFCVSTISIKATRCPQCTSELKN